MQKELIPTNRGICICGIIVLGCWALAIKEYALANGALVGLLQLIKGDS